MGYRAGLGMSMAALGYTPCEPHVYCDGCGREHAVTTRRGGVAQWFLARRSPPKWRGESRDDGTRTDYCPPCEEARRGR